MIIASAPIVPLIERAGRAFAVRLSDIPQPWQDRFRIALRGSACPVIDGEGECAYAWDWRDWLQGSFQRGRVVEMFDSLDGPEQEAIPLDAPGVLESLRQDMAKRGL